MNLLNDFIRTYFAVSPQKTAEQIQAIPEDNKIYLEDWDISTGYLVVNLHHIWWPEDVKCFEKQFEMWELKEFCERQYVVAKSFSEWWACWSTRMQRKMIENLIDIHKPTLRKELEEYHNGNQ